MILRSCAIGCCLVAVALAADTAPVIPSWLEPYPGTSARTHSFPNTVESSYQTAADPADVVEHYARLFASAGLRFEPRNTSFSTTIRGETPECDLTINIRKLAANTVVRISCTVHPEIPGVRRSPNRGVAETMSKYDQPVYPKQRKKLPPLEWPTWLIHCDGAALRVQRGVDIFKLNYIKAVFASASARDEILSFYAALLNSHGYEVYAQSSRITPARQKAVVEGAYYFDEQPGPRFVIRAELTPVDGATQVELRITAHP